MTHTSQAQHPRQPRYTGDRVADQEISLKTRPIQLIPRSWLIAVRSPATMEAPDQQEKVRGTTRQGCRPRGSLGPRRRDSAYKWRSWETREDESRERGPNSKIRARLRHRHETGYKVSLTSTRQTQRRGREVFHQNPYQSNRLGPLRIICPNLGEPRKSNLVG